MARGVSLGLLRVRPGTAGETVRRLKRVLPARHRRTSCATSWRRREQDFWVNQTSTGKIFASGVLVAMAVAAVVVYQVLSNDVRSHLPEYATLKAMGYTNRYLSRVVVVQALIYALGAFGPAVVVAYIAYRATEALAGIPMRMTVTNLALALGLAVAREPPLGGAHRGQAAHGRSGGALLNGTAGDGSTPGHRLEPIRDLARTRTGGYRRWPGATSTESKVRLAASVAGTAFAVTLMFMELGFRGALLDSMVAVVGRSTATCSSSTGCSTPWPFRSRSPMRRLEQARSFDEVTWAGPFYVEMRRARWRNPVDGIPRRIRVARLPPADETLTIEPLRADRDLWERPDTRDGGRALQGRPLRRLEHAAGRRSSRAVGSRSSGRSRWALTSRATARS